MKSSSLKVFSIIQNTKKYITKNKDVDIFKNVSHIWYSKTSEYNIRHCKRIYNEIENGFYNYYDLSFYLLYTYIFNEKIDLSLVKDKNINKIAQLFTDKQLKKDQEFMIELSKITKIIDIEEYFKTNRNGGNIIYDELIAKKRISPYFYIEYGKEEKEENENEELKRFKKIIKKFKQILKKKKESTNG
jgi:hypothetical protein